MASDEERHEVPRESIVLDKGVVKEALSELLNEIPAFRSLIASSKSTTQPHQNPGGSGGQSSGVGAGGKEVTRKTPTGN